MRINGLMKMTLLDFPGRVACTVFTAGCNMRCPFCHNAALVTDIDPNECIDEEEIFGFLEKRRGILDGVAVTGGEPLLQPDIEGFIRRVRSLGYAVKLDTNGSFPDRLASLIEKGLLDYVAMDVKNCPERYGETVGVKGFDIAPILESIRLLTSCGVEHEFRTTVVRQFHDVAAIAGAARLIAGAEKYFLQSFVDSGGLIGDGLSGVPRDEMELMRRAAAKYVPNTAIRGA